MPYCCRNPKTIKNFSILIGIIDAIWIIYNYKDLLMAETPMDIRRLVKFMYLGFYLLSVLAFIVGIKMEKYKLMKLFIGNQICNILYWIGLTLLSIDAYFDPRGICGDHIGGVITPNKDVKVEDEEIQKMAFKLAIWFFVGCLFQVLFILIIAKCYKHIENHKNTSGVSEKSKA